MNALKTQHILDKIEQKMHQIAPDRNPLLFNEFLMKGYKAITLNCVPDNQFSELLRIKLCLGTLITLYDDLADNPKKCNPNLLEILYQLNFQVHSTIRSLKSHDNIIIEFAESLFFEISETLCKLPNYKTLNSILNYDLKQFYSANQYSSLVMSHYYINNVYENRLYTHHNMGMIMVGMIDLMACKKIDFSEFGEIRQVLLMGQRMGRIFNVIATHQREVHDGDITGELSSFHHAFEVEIAKNNLKQEIQDLYKKIFFFQKRITTFSVKQYLEGLMIVENLHKKMEGII